MPDTVCVCQSNTAYMTILNLLLVKRGDAVWSEDHCSKTRDLLFNFYKAKLILCMCNQPLQKVGVRLLTNHFS